MIFIDWKNDPTEDDGVCADAEGLTAGVEHRVSVDFEGTPDEVRYEYWNWLVGTFMTVTDEHGTYDAFEHIAEGTTRVSEDDGKKYCEAVATVYLEGRREDPDRG